MIERDDWDTNTTFVSAHDKAMQEQKDRAARLATEQRCPHCNEPISLLDALCIVRGRGWKYSVRIKLADGTLALVPEGAFNPQTMLWAGDK